MYRALRIFKSGDDPTIYQKVFFDQKHKFQYPPTSLIVMDVIQRIIGDDLELRTVLDWISWMCVIGTVFFTWLIFREGLQRYVPEETTQNTWLSIMLIVLLGLTFYPLLRAYILGQIQTWLNFLFALSLWFWIENSKGK